MAGISGGEAASNLFYVCSCVQVPTTCVHMRVLAGLSQHQVSFKTGLHLIVRDRVSHKPKAP